MPHGTATAKNFAYSSGRPGSAATRVSRPWSASKATLAVGDGVAPVA